MLLKQKICCEISKRLKFGFSLSSQIGLGISILHAHRFKETNEAALTYDINMYDTRANAT